MAIALDTVGGIRTAGASPFSQSFTMGTVSNGYLVAYIENDGGDLVTGVTYNSVAMTQIVKVLVPSSTLEIYMYGLANPSSGAHNITVTASGPTCYVTAISYSGVSSTIDNSTSNTGTGTGVFNTSLTTVANNCWAVLGTQSTGANLTASTGLTFRQNDVGSDGRNNGVYDSNGALGTGAHTLAVTRSTSASIGTVAISLAPFVAPPANGKFLVFM